MLIRHRVGEAVGEAVADIERLDRAVAVIQRIGIGAVGVEGHRAVGARDGGADIAGLAIDLGDGEAVGDAGGDVGVRVVRQHVAEHRNGVLRQRRRIGGGDGAVIQYVGG